MAHMFSRLRGKVRSLGWRDSLLFTIDFVLRRVSLGSAKLIKYYFVAQPVAAHPTSTPRLSGSTRMYLTMTRDAIICQAPRPPQTLQSRFEQRARCVVAERAGELAGFIWLCPDCFHEDEVRCVYSWAPGPAAVWDFDVFIAPPFRMSRVFARLWNHAHDLLAKEHVRWTLSRIDAFNAGSLAAHRRLGARVVARGWFLVVGNMQITFSSVSPHWHVSMSDADAPSLCFDLSKIPDESLTAHP